MSRMTGFLKPAHPLSTCQGVLTCCSRASCSSAWTQCPLCSTPKPGCELCVAPPETTPPYAVCRTTTRLTALYGVQHCQWGECSAEAMDITFTATQTASGSLLLGRFTESEALIRGQWHCARRERRLSLLCCVQ